MTGLVVLDVVIGLVFIYLLYSLLATIFMEIISTWLDLRAKFLAKAIVRMLDDNKPNAVLPWKSTLDGYKLAKKFFDHPIVSKMNKGGMYTKPSYISNENFSRILLDLIGIKEVKEGENPIDFIKKQLDDNNFWDEIPHSSQTRTILKNFIVEAEGNLTTFKQLIENWFNDMMYKTTEWYKGHTRLILFVIGFVIAFSFNVDSIMITKNLSQDEDLRNELVAQAQKYLDTHAKLMEVKYSDSLKNDNMDFKEIQKRSLELSAKADTLLQNDIKSLPQTIALGWNNSSTKAYNRLYSILGWLITALAISMGSNFWFELLNKLMKLRNAVTDKEALNNATTSETQKK